MFRKLLVAAVSLVLLGLNANAQASTLNFTFTGECDDCAFMGNPSDEDFDPLGDGLTQTVTANLRFDGVTITNGAITSAEGFLFEYGGSSLINPFAFNDAFLDTSFNLLATGDVVPDNVLILSSSSNPNSEFDFNFPDFCTAQGQLVFGESGDSGCSSVGIVEFMLDSEGNFSVSGTEAFDIGVGGTLTPVSAVPLPAAFWFFGSALLGLIGVGRKRA